MDGWVGWRLVINGRQELRLERKVGWLSLITALNKKLFMLYLASVWMRRLCASDAELMGGSKNISAGGWRVTHYR